MHLQINWSQLSILFFYKNMIHAVLILQMIAFSAGWMWATYDDGWIRITLAVVLTWASLAGIAWVLIPAAIEVEDKVANIVDSFADTDETV